MGKQLDLKYYKEWDFNFLVSKIEIFKKTLRLRRSSMLVCFKVKRAVEEGSVMTFE